MTHTLRFLMAAALVAVTLSGCGWFEKKKTPLVGERVSVFSDRKELEPDKDAASINITLPAPVANDSWPQSGGFANHAMEHLEIGPSPQVLWTADVGAGTSSSRILTAGPVVAEGKVFVKDAESTVSAFDANTGGRIWSVTLKPEKARDANEFGGGVAYYGGRLFVTTGFADVFCLDPNDGHEIWNSTVSAPIRGAPLVFGDRVFSISIDNKLHAMAAVDGSDLWNFTGLQEVAGYVGGNSAAGASDVIVAPFSSGELVELRAENGRTVWNESLVGPRRESRAFGNLADIRGRPVIDRDLVIAMGSAGTIAAIDLRAGQRIWERNVGGSQTPWLAGRFIFVVTSGADVAALERSTGKVKWVTPLTQYADEKRREPIQWAGPVLASDRLLIGGSTGELLALSPYTGEVTGKLELREPMRLAPVIANRTIFILADSGRLIALR
ncbi:MAG TPA: PQQ-binding-like beta-propeller repeat protein [Reyranella sp.]|jgi:outer membrane protein assembly factor BamB|nr:PQQ-binding-like beta-propeller repeat protein [Reyranella sp.]